jgi:hypothetical protein
MTAAKELSRVTRVKGERFKTREGMKDGGGPFPAVADEL